LKDIGEEKNFKGSPMKLITESLDNIKCIVEETKHGGKNYFIQGVFMQAETLNRNGRIYPQDTLIRETARYAREAISQKRALGELGHPDGPQINLERVSHVIESLSVDGNNVIGKAKLLGTPYGQIARNFVEEGIKLGVSSRGLGTLKEVGGYYEVQEDFQLAAVDLVAEPSAPDAFVQGIMEGREWIYENGIIKEVAIETWKKQIKKAHSNELESLKLKVFEEFLRKLK